MMPIFLALVPFPRYWPWGQQGPLMICSSGMNMRVDGNIERHFLIGQRILFEKDIIPFQKKYGYKKSLSKAQVKLLLQNFIHNPSKQ